MRVAVVLVALCTALTGCSGGTSEEDADVGAVQVQKTTTELARESIRIVAGTIGATQAEAEAQWRGCMPELSWQYAGEGVLTAPEADPAQQLEDIRTALLDAGYTDVTAVDGHVSVERDSYTLDVREPGAAYGPGAWRVSFFSDCLSWSGEDRSHVESGERRVLEGLLP